MAESKLIVFTNPKPGEDAAYNKWYDEVHLPDVLAVPGVRSAKRYRIATPGAGELKHGYLAIYELDGDYPAVMEAMTARVESGQMVICDAFDTENVSLGIYEPM
jgi:hypothetical protein